MARGYLAGALWGAVVAGLGGATASVVTGPVMAPKPEVSEAVAGAAGAPPAAEPDQLPTTSQLDGASPQTASPGIPAPDSGAEAAGVTETASTGLPETGGASDLPDAPEAGERAALASTGDAPVSTGGQGAQPSQPAADELSISNNPVQPPAPVPTVDEAAPQLGGQAPETDTAMAAPSAEVPVEAEATENAQVQDGAAPESAFAAEAPAAAPSASADAPETAQASDAGAPPDSPSAEAAAPDPGDAPQAPAAQVETDVAVLPATPTAEEEAPTPQVAEVAEPERPQVNALIDRAGDGRRPTVGTPAGTFTDRSAQVRTNRLPTLGDEPPTAPQAAEQAPARPPLEAFAQQVDVAGDKPLMSIVLIDDGSTPLGLEALESFPYPLTFAVDTAWSGAGEAMRRYRDAGFEVMALANLPEGAQPADAEVTLGTALDAIPEAVAVLEGDSGGLQETRGISEQVAQILADSGHGLVLYPKGLNTGQALAARSGVPSATLFRDFDGKGQTATVMRRFLDQAAFKAGQEGAVIMLGRLKAETISALLIWGLQDRASRVSFVPVSKVLLFDEADS